MALHAAGTEHPSDATGTGLVGDDAITGVAHQERSTPRPRHHHWRRRADVRRRNLEVVLLVEVDHGDAVHDRARAAAGPRTGDRHREESAVGGEPPGTVESTFGTALTTEMVSPRRR